MSASICTDGAGKITRIIRSIKEHALSTLSVHQVLFPSKVKDIIHRGDNMLDYFGVVNSRFLISTYLISPKSVFTCLIWFDSTHTLLAVKVRVTSGTVCTSHELICWHYDPRLPNITFIIGYDHSS